MELRQACNPGLECKPAAGLKVLCVIPARGGSRNAPLQSFRLLAGKPLLAYTAETALAAAHLSKVVLSTDDEDVAEVGRRCGLEPLTRPIELSPEDAGVQRIVQDAVRRLEEAGDSCDAVCILDPASPFRRPEDIDRCIELLERSGADCVATVIPVPREYHPYTLYFQAPDGSLAPCASASAPVGCPGDLPPAFRHDGSVCVIRRDALMNRNGLFGERTVGYAMDPSRQVNLDRPDDWGRAERIAKLGTHQATAGRIAPLVGPRLNLPAGWMAVPIADPLVSAGVGLWKGAIAGAPPALVWSRERDGDAMRIAEGWALFGQESAAIAFGSIESRPHGVTWPAARTFLLRRQSERPAKAGIRERSDPREEQVFPVRATAIPASVGFRARLPRAPVTKAPAPSVRIDIRTLAGARSLAAEFPDSGEPIQTPIFQTVLKTALIPQGVFHYIEIEDHDDHGTRKRAPHYAAAPLMPDSGCGVRSRACLEAAGYHTVIAGPHAGNATQSRPFKELRRASQVALANSQTGIAAMDFAAIAAASSPRWRLSLKKTFS